MKKVLKVEGMACNHCRANVINALSKVNSPLLYTSEYIIDISCIQETIKSKFIKLHTLIIIYSFSYVNKRKH